MAGCWASSLVQTHAKGHPPRCNESWSGPSLCHLARRYRKGLIQPHTSWLPTADHGTSGTDACQSDAAINELQTLVNILPAAFAYHLGNRSALEWVYDQYEVSTDTRRGIVSDPTCVDDEEYIVHLVGRVITVSIETTRLVEALPSLDGAT